ncbi:MAG TPA: NAD(P)/FAD-dependent oxidoreductase [Candidatus Acidoferrales bacterium]|nr:NAD(P)/FAD-dependent oxidoreductase [Candidatus Acidoferrales bacterium]HVC38781.1 NAD(P)/FAD-dependent oxidoreductase [Candidatus Dormibacteraeota bacterium]
MGESVDAVVVGSGPNGMAAALTLAAEGLEVLVLEGADTPGGGCRTAELTLPGYQHDLCSTAHPLAAASSFFRRFDLGARGVRMVHPEVVFAHPLDGGRAAIVTRSVAETAAGLGRDRRTYRRLIGPLVRHADQIADWTFSGQRRPPTNPTALAGFGLRGLRSASSVAQRFRSEEARGLFAGVSAHAMRPLTRPPTAGVGLLLTMLGHAVGWPFVEGGSVRLTEAMVAALEANGGTLEMGHWVRSLDELPAAKAVLLDITPRQLLALAGDRVSGRYRRSLERFRYGAGVCKVDFALSGPVPWSHPGCRAAGTVHLGGTFEEVARSEADVAAGRHPVFPYVLVGQAGTADATRAPQGGQTLWAYCHVPADSDVDMTPHIEAQIERFAPGFRDLVLAKVHRTAQELEAHNPNCVGGDIASGSQDLWQTFFRPAPRWAPYRTPIPDTYLCSASTTPGPGVHGRCGELAALSALRHTFGIAHPRGRLSPAPEPEALVIAVG